MECTISIYDYKNEKLKSYDFPTEEANKVMDEIDETYKRAGKGEDFITLVFDSSENRAIGTEPGYEDKMLNEKYPKFNYFSPNDLKGIIEILEK